MPRRCEVCASHRAFALPGEPRTRLGPERVRMVLVEARILALCAHHAAELARAGASTLAEVAALFREPTGARSFVSRRAALDRRVFPPRPEGRRAVTGRRAGDPPA